MSFITALIIGIVLGGIAATILHFLVSRPQDNHKIRREGDAYYRVLLEAIPEMIFFLDREGKFLDYIPAIDLKSYVPKEEFIGKTYREVLPPDVAALHDEAFQRVTQEGKNARVEYQLDMPSGLRDYEARLIQANDDRVVSLVRDITERKNALRNVQRQAQELAALHGISVDITAAQELDDLLETSVLRAVELLDGKCGTIYLQDEKKDQLNREAEYISTDDAIPPFELGSHIAVDTARGFLSRIVDNHELSERYDADFDNQPHLSVLSVPLVWDENIIGIINIWVEDHALRTLSKDLQLLDKLATQIAIAVRNAQLLAHLETQLLLSQTMHEVGALLTSHAGLDEVLEKVLDLLDRVIDFDSSSILLKAEDGKLNLSASRGIPEIDKVSEAIRHHADEILPHQWMERKTVYISDTKRSEEWVPIPETNYIRSWIGAVLYAQDKFIGMLSVDSREIDAYDSEDMKTVRAFADQAAIAIENARLFQETQTSHHRLQVLYELNNQLAETLDWDTIIKRTTTIAHNALGGEVADYYHYDQESGEIELINSVGRQKKEIQIIKEMLITLEDTGDLQWVLENQESVRMSNVLEDDRWIVIPDLDRHIRSLITVPVFIDDQLSGALSVLHRERNAFSAEHEELLNAISQQTGLALNNARRYKEVQRLIDALEARQRMQRTLFEHLPVGVLLLDDHYRILYSNELGEEYVDAINDHQQGILQNLGSRSMDELVKHQRDPRPLEISEKHNGSRVYEAQIRPVSSAEEFYWVLMIDDVTQEQEQDRRLQMQERLATIGQFAAGITHDFNNIMSAIQVYADVLSRDENISEENVDRVQVIQKQAQRATDLISQILDFSRHAVIEHKPIDILSFIQEIGTLLERVLPEDIRISLEISGNNRPLTVSGDATRLQQMIMNLAVNARDAMPEGGELAIHVGEIEIAEYQVPPLPSMDPGRWVKLTVRDHGIGIPESDREHVFEPFYTTKGSGEGTGLGLAQVYGIVKQHGGFIDMDSVVGEGTSFYIYLPLARKPAEVQFSSNRSDPIDGQGDLALIVEDDKSLRNALWNLFEECNFQVILAKNGQDGLKIIEQIGKKITLVITDLVMPEMGGIEMYRKARKHYPDLKFLFITGHREASQKIDLIHDSSVGRLQKPFTMEEIIGAVNNLHDWTASPVKR